MRIAVTVMNVPGVPLPGANVPPETLRLGDRARAANVPPLTFAPPLSAPLFVVCGGVGQQAG